MKIPLQLKRSIDEYQRQYTTPLPGEEIEVAREIKITPIYKKLKENGAQYIDSYGWEKPKWFSPKGEREKYSYSRSNAFNHVKNECENVQNGAGVSDLSTFA